MEWVLMISLGLLIFYLLRAASHAERLHQQEMLEEYIEEARLRHLDELYGRNSGESSSNKIE